MIGPVIKIVPMDPALPEARALIDLLDAHQIALYPPESNHLESVEALRQPNVLFVGAWEKETLVACGAVKTLDDDGCYGEIKRVFVRASHRGRGISRTIMHHLEAHLVANGVPFARLETGIKQPEAIGLYRALGYALRGPYGAYAVDPLSVFMEKILQLQPKDGANRDDKHSSVRRSV